MEHLDTRVLWNLGPPRLRYEDAILDVAASADRDFEAIALLGDAVQARRTTAHRMIQTLDDRQIAPRRSFLRAVLMDVAEGTCSVLEHGYLTRVERPHGLPRARRQLRSELPRVSYRDAEYDEGLIVELDGRLFHNSTRSRDSDMDRDLDAAVDGRHTVRISWGQVFDRGCATALRIGLLLTKRGWTGSPRPCGQTCPIR